MYLVNTSKLNIGMRISTPILNRRGDICIPGNTKLDANGINIIKATKALGVYVLEDSEPALPVSKEGDDLYKLAYTYSQAMDLELKEAVAMHHLHRLEDIGDEIIDATSKIKKRVFINRDIRTKEDFIFRHSVNAAILSGLMATKIGLTIPEKRKVVYAALSHDIGKTIVPEKFIDGEDPAEVMRILDNSQDVGFELLNTLFKDVDEDVYSICVQSQKILSRITRTETGDEEKISDETAILMTADTFDSMTAMDLTGEKEPKSYIEVVNFMMSRPDVFNKKVVNALLDSVIILYQGMTVLLSNGNRALIMSENNGKNLFPTVLEFSTNRMIDLSDRVKYGDLFISGTVKKLDSRYSMK